MEQCHFCGGSLTRHRENCRTHSDMDLFERVHQRLVQEARNRELQASLERYLVLYGRRYMGKAAE